MVFGIGGLFTLMMSMTADVCDLDELNNGMPRKEGTFGAIYWWMVKLGQGLALGIRRFGAEIGRFRPAYCPANRRYHYKLKDRRYNRTCIYRRTCHLGDVGI